MLPQQEALYGGAAGGGKSDALLRAAVQYVDIPGYKALLLRRNFPQLSQAGGLIDRSKQWLSGRATWNEQKHRWTFPSGAILEFGHLQRKDSHFDYQGAEYDFIGFDELTHFEEDQYLYLFSRLRSAGDSPVPPRMRSASNPGGRGHAWVKRRFVDRLPKPNDPHDTPEKCRQRIFIPARLADNPGLDHAEYLAALSQLDSQTLAQLRDGDWEARGAGQWVFDGEGLDAAIELGRTLDQNGAPEPTDGLSLGIDWGEHTTATVLGWPLERGGLYIPGELQLHGAEPAAATSHMLNLAAGYPHELTEARYDAAGAQSMRTFIANSPETIGIWKVAFSKHKEAAIGYLRQLFERAADGKETRVIAISPRNETLIRQLRAYEINPDTGKPVKGDDHSIDALIACVAPVAARHREMIG